MWYVETSYEADAYSQVQDWQPEMEALSNELVIAAASYEAARLYKEHVANYGKPDTQEEAKELVAGFSSEFIDNIIASKSLDYIDCQTVKENTTQKIHEVVVVEYEVVEE